MIHPARADRLIAIEEDLDDILGWEPSVIDDPDVIALLDQYEAELIRNGHL